jgi:hypothetical protein
VANEIIPYHEMCQREMASLQRGMNFNLGRTYSVILMSVRRNAPYHDSYDKDGATIIYEGHDVPRNLGGGDPKTVDQTAVLASGRKTQNGLFYEAAIKYKQGESEAHLVRVYEKIHEGIWSYNGVFLLADGWQEFSRGRRVFKFKLVAADAVDDPDVRPPELNEHRRLIPTHVKIEVWDRDKGKCVVCGATTELHFDHDLPYSNGGTSLTAANVQLLCARHNLSKGAKII